MFSWKSQSTKGDYKIQIETDDLERYKMVENFCQNMIDNNITNISKDKTQIEYLDKGSYQEQKYNIKLSGLYNDDCCKYCQNNPKNGGSGICNCILPYMTKTGGVTCGTTM